MVQPLLSCYKRIQSSSLMESLQEGRTFDQRIKTLLEAKLLKKRIDLDKLEDDDESKAVVLDEVIGI